MRSQQHPIRARDVILRKAPSPPRDPTIVELSMQSVKVAALQAPYAFQFAADRAFTDIRSSPPVSPPLRMTGWRDGAESLPAPAFLCSLRSLRSTRLSRRDRPQTSLESATPNCHRRS